MESFRDDDGGCQATSSFLELTDLSPSPTASPDSPSSCTSSSACTPEEHLSPFPSVDISETLHAKSYLNNTHNSIGSYTSRAMPDYDNDPCDAGLEDFKSNMLDYDEGIEDIKSYDMGYQYLQEHQENRSSTSSQNAADVWDQQQQSSSNNNNNSGADRSNNNNRREEEEEDDEDNSTASSTADDVSSGFGSGGGYDNLSYISIGVTGVDLSSLLMDPNDALMLEDDYGDGVEDDEDLDSPVERLMRRSRSHNTKARGNVCISIPSTLHQVMESSEDVEAVMRLVHQLADDGNQSVRIELMEQLPQLTVLCQQYPLHLGGVMDEHLLPLIIKHVGNHVCQVRKTTQAALLVVLEQRLLSRPQIEVLCRAVVDLTEQLGDRSEDDRTDGVALMSRMAPIMGRELTVQLFLERFTALCADLLWQIRKICAANFGEFTTITGTETTEQVLLSVFVSLCKDNVWEVRKSCCESFTTVASAVLPSTRRDSLSPIFVHLLTDQSRWVRVSAYQNLGMFIATFAAPDAMERTSPTYEDAVLDAAKQYSSSSTATSYGNNDNEVPSDSPASSSCSILESTSAPTTEEIQESNSSYNSFNYWRMPLPHVDLSEVSSVSEESSNKESQKDTSEVTTPKLDTSSDDYSDVALAQAAVACLAITNDTKSPDQRKRRHAVRDAENMSSQLERASEPMPFSEVLIEEGTDTNKTEEDLNSSTDSTDSEDTIIELNTLSQGLLSEDDDDNTSDAFRDGFRDRLQRQEMDARDLWLTVIDNNHMTSSMDSNTEEEIANKVKQQHVVPERLLQLFLMMVDPRRAESEEKDITRHCAFSMPGVALTLGRENWSVLRDTYLLLAENFQWRVRRTLAYSMHQLASILGGELATADLLPLFREFTVNEPECVRIGVLENLADFVRVLPPEQRKAMLPTMKFFFGIHDRRHRQEFGRQLVHLLKLYPPSDCEEHLKLYCLILLTDNVVYNRQKCYGLISLLIERLGSEGDTHYVVGVCETLCKKFALDATWCRRQTFVFVAGRVFADCVVPIELYCEHLLPQLLALAQDRVPNVRLAVAEALTNQINHHEYFHDCSNPETAEVREVYRNLQRDKDRDVRYFADSCLTMEQVEEIHGEKYSSARSEAVRQDYSSYSSNPFIGNQVFLSESPSDVLSRAFERLETIPMPSSPCLEDTTSYNNNSSNSATTHNLPSSYVRQQCHYNNSSNSSNSDDDAAANNRCSSSVTQDDATANTQTTTLIPVPMISPADRSNNAGDSASSSDHNNPSSSTHQQSQRFPSSLPSDECFGENENNSDTSNANNSSSLSSNSSENDD